MLKKQEKIGKNKLLSYDQKFCYIIPTNINGTDH